MIMAAYLGQRLVVLAVSLGLLTVVVFGLTQALPGDVARMIVGQFYDPVAVDALRKDLGLNDPLYVQYGRWASHVLQGDFGRSLVIKRPVAPIVADAFLKSLSLGVCTVVVVGIFGTALGVLGAVKRNSLVDHVTAIVAFLGISVPEFFTGILLITLSPILVIVPLAIIPTLWLTGRSETAYRTAEEGAAKHRRMRGSEDYSQVVEQEGSLVKLSLGLLELLLLKAPYLPVVLLDLCDLDLVGPLD